jgi:hypothetical protein
VKMREELLKGLSVERRPVGSGSAAILTQWLKWLVPATALVALAGIVMIYAKPKVKPSPAATLAAAAPLQADKVEIDRQLLAQFEAVGRLPDGRPVRFRCAQWMDDLLVHDSADGLVLKRTAPRLEIVPIGFETY